MDNGMAYDFGISIAKGTVSALASMVLSTTALAGAVYSLIAVSNELDDILNRNRIAMGGYVGSLKALEYVSAKLANGQTFFDPSDSLDGMRLLQRAGIDAKKQFDLVAKAADGMGMSFTSMSQIIHSGDFNALAEAGIITDRMALSYQNMQFNAGQASRQVLKLIAASNSKGMFEDTITSIPQILTRMRQFGRDFVTAIVGDPKDPEGLVFTVKKYLTKITEFLNKHRNQIIYYGKMIGSTLRFIIQVSGDFLKRVFRTVSAALGIQKKSTQEMKNGLMSFNLWLGILRAKIGHFFDEYGARIKQLFKLYLLLKAIDIGFNLLGFIPLIGRPLQNFIANLLVHTIRLSAALLSFNSANIAAAFAPISKGALGLLTTIRLATVAAYEFLAAALMNPYVWIAIAIAGIVAMLVYWGETRKAVQNVSDTVLVLIGFITPLLAIVLLLAKYWNDFKAIFINIWATITNVVKLAGLYIQQVWQKVVKFFKIGLYPIYLAFSVIIDAVKKLWTGLKTFIMNLWTSIVDWFKSSWVGRIVGWLADGTKDLADASAKLLEKKQKEMGKKTTANHGVTTAQLNKAEADAEAKKPTAPNNPLKTTPVEYSGKMDGMINLPSPNISTDNKNQSKTTQVNAGAVVINVHNKDIDERKIALLVKQILDETGETDKARKGIIKNYE